jgi:hypothetical protein
VYDTRGIDDHQLPEDLGSSRERRGVLEQSIERQIVGPRKRNPVCQRSTALPISSTQNCSMG